MKKLSTLMTMALVAMMALTLTSCDEDYDIAYTLEGTWRGNMYVSSVYDGYTYDATYTELCFVQDPYRYSSGTGYWIDHYAGDAPWRYVANHTEWKVRGGVSASTSWRKTRTLRSPTTVSTTTTSTEPSIMMTRKSSSA